MYKIELLLQNETTRVETLEVEKAKIQEEFDTLSQTLNYNINDLQEKKRLLNEAHVQVALFLSHFINLYSFRVRIRSLRNLSVELGNRMK